MKKQSIIILGAGIAGLAAAWKLRDHDVMVLEASPRAGGWIQTIQQEGFQFELGPRSCRTYGNGAATVRLIEELGMQDEILAASPAAQIRYILQNQKLVCIPSSFLEWMRSPFLSPVVRGCFRDFFTGGISEDCSIEEFVTKRLGDKFLDLFINPLVSGVYAGDPKVLSIDSCFPALYQLQKEQGSLMKGMVSNLFKKKKAEKSLPFPLFTLKRGLSSLVERLVEKLGSSRIHYNSKVIGVKKVGAEWTIQTAHGEEYKCERVISTLPGHMVEELWGFKSPPCSSVAVVNLGYDHFDSDLQGFGYLVPKKEREQILGVVWDSIVFPEQQIKREQGRLTVMIGGTQAPSDWRRWDYVDVALQALKRHMGISAAPDATHVFLADRAIPQFEVGYRNRLEGFLKEMNTNYLGLEFGGALVDGVAINDCIYGAEKFVTMRSGQ